MKNLGAPAHPKTDEEWEWYRFAAESLLHRRIAAMPCSDCPPVGYPTDRTRCEECPRRGGVA